MAGRLALQIPSQFAPFICFEFISQPAFCRPAVPFSLMLVIEFGYSFVCT